MHSVEARPKARNEYMKRKHARPGASPLTCRSFLNIGRISTERRVALMLHCFVRGVERDVGPYTLLDAPNQFLELCLPPLRRTPIVYHIPFAWCKRDFLGEPFYGWFATCSRIQSLKGNSLKPNGQPLWFNHFYVRKPLCIFFACQHDRFIIRDTCSMYDSVDKARTCLGKIGNLQRRSHIS